MARESKRNVETTKLFKGYSIQLCLRFLLFVSAAVLCLIDSSLIDIKHPFQDPAGHVFAYVLFLFFVFDFTTKLTTRSKIAIGSKKQYKNFQIPTPSTAGMGREELFDYIRSLVVSGRERSGQIHFHPVATAQRALDEARQQFSQGTVDAIAAAKRTLHDVDVLRLLPFSDADLDVSQDIRSKFRFRRLSEIAGVLIFWILFNACIAMALYILGWLTPQVCVVWTCFYFVFDMICVVLWCPLQILFMHNRCCTTCQIFNWDGIMAVTPLVFVPCPYSWVLLALALVVLLRWEITAFVYPERFFEETNASLSCANCHDKLCRFRPPILEPLAPTSKQR